MPIYEKNKLYFIHIPKTAGTSVKTFLNKNLEPLIKVNKYYHSKIAEVENFKKYKCFCIVRDPISRAKSHYRWFRNSSDYDQFPHKILALELNFEDWLNRWFIPEARTQCSFFLVNGEISDNLSILQYENLYQDLEWYLNGELKLYLDIKKLPHILKTNKEEDFTCSEGTLEKIKQKEFWLYDNKYY